MTFLVAALLFAAPHDNVDRWNYHALRAGWHPDELPWLRCVINRESGGNPAAYNRHDPNGGSRGLVGINGAHNSWLRKAGIIKFPGDLYRPYINLRAARVLYKIAGKDPWRSTTNPC
jgi:hypothetical protein